MSGVWDFLDSDFWGDVSGSFTSLFDRETFLEEDGVVNSFYRDDDDFPRLFSDD